MTYMTRTLYLFAALALAGCGDDGGGGGDPEADAGETDVATGDGGGEDGGSEDDGGGESDTENEDIGADGGEDALEDVSTDIGDQDADDSDVSDAGEPDVATDASDTGVDVTPDTGDAGTDGGMDTGDGVTEPPDDREDDSYDPLLGSWSPDFGVAGMTGDLGGQVYATVFDADSGLTYAGGNFTNAGGVPARNVAVWNGLEWEPVGDGLGISVNALAIDPDSGMLYAAGSGGGGFIPTPSFVYEWDGTSWTALGTELPMFTRVSALTFFEDELVALGNFDASWSGQAGIGVWEADSWTSFSGGAGASEINAGVVYGGEFCVGGSFSEIDGVSANNVACLDGDAWTAAGDGLNSIVSDLEVDGDGTLFAAGYFSFDSEVGIATFDGSEWTSFEGGVAGGLTTQVRDIVITDDALFIGGQFGSVGGEIPAGNIAAWVDGSWRGMSGGVVNRVGITIEPGVFAMAEDDEGGLYVGGDFSEAGGVTTSNYAYWDGLAWGLVYDPTKSANGISGVVEALAASPDGTIYAGGSFTSAGSATALNIAAYDGAEWAEVGIGLEGGIRALAVDGDGTLWVGGAFSGVGPDSADNFAYFDGVVFRSVIGSPDGTVSAISICDDGTMYVTGDFTSADGVMLNGVGHYDPDTGWSALGGGLAGEGFWQVPAVVCADDGSAYVGGGFTSVDGEAISYLAHWTGSEWEAVGDAPDDSITALDWYDGSLYAGGAFTAFGSTDIVGAAVYDGTGWSELGDGLATEFDFSRGESVDIIAKENGVFATGFITRSGETELGFVGWFDGTEWHDLAGGVDDLTSAGIVDDGRFIVGGPFTNAGGAPSLGIAMWNYLP